MKRTALLFILLSCLFFLPAQAESLPEGYAPVTVITRGDFQMALADAPEGSRVFIGSIRDEDGWHHTISTPVPQGAVLFAESGTRDPYAVLAFPHPQAQDGAWVEHFIAPAGGRWDMVLREDGQSEVYTVDDPSAWEVCMTACGSEEISYRADQLWDLHGLIYYGRFTLSRDVTQVDWPGLPTSFREAMALTDATGMEKKNALWEWDSGESDTPWEPDPALAAFLEAHLPGYSAWDGEVSGHTAVLLADDAQGTRFLITGEGDGTAWRFSVSQPLPAGTEIAADLEWDSAEMYIPLPREKQRRYEGLRELLVGLAREPETGAWHIAHVNTGMEILTIEEFAISGDTGPVYYGTPLIDADAARTDWSALPHNQEAVMDCVDTSAWRIAAAAPTLLHAFADADSPILGRYFPGAPLLVLDEQSGWVQVEVLDTGCTGWMAADDLIPASQQLYQPWADDPDLHSIYYWDNLYPLPEAILEDDDPVLALHAAPHAEAAAPFPVSHVEYLRLLGLCAEGCCYHVYHASSGASGWVSVAEMPRMYQDTAFIASHVPGYVQDHLHQPVYMGETTVMALVHLPGQHPENGGSMRFMGAVLADGAWQVTLSAPFPAGLWPSIDTYHAGDGTIAVSFLHPELFAQHVAAGDEDPDMLADRMYVIELRDGVWEIVTVGGEMTDFFYLDDHAVCDSYGFEYYGDFIFSRDVTQVDWLAFPATLEDVLAQTDSGAWSVLWASEFLRAEPQGESLILGRYFPGTWVRRLESRDGWTQVQLPGGLTGWMESDVLAAAESAPFIARLPQVKTGAGIADVLGASEDGTTLHCCDIHDGWTGFIPAANCEAYPYSLYWRVWPMNGEEALAQAVREGLVFLSRDTALMAQPDPGALNRGRYVRGVWAEVLESRGEWRRIRIHDSAEGWVPADCLSGAETLLLPRPPVMKLRMGEPAVQLLDAPQGQVIAEYYTDWPTSVTLLGNLGNGWYHVHDGASAGYLRQTDCEGYR